MKKAIPDEKMLELLLTHGTVRETAAALGISARAIYSRLAKPEFRRQYDELRATVLENGTAVLGDAVSDAAQYLHGVLDDEVATIGQKIQAADSIFRHHLRYAEFSVLQRRVEELEKRLDEAEANNE